MMEWVETIEPDSGSIIYANPLSGKVLKEPPPGAVV